MWHPQKRSNNATIDSTPEFLDALRAQNKIEMRITSNIATRGGALFSSTLFLAKIYLAAIFAPDNQKK